jgi:uncharacterized protein
VIVYLDASAIVKTVIDERGSAVAIDVWNAAATRVTSVIAYAEARAALAAAHRAGRLSDGRRRRTRALLDRRWAEIARIEVTNAIVGLAGDLAEREALRGYDAVHLATALTTGADDEVLMVTWDRPLSEAAHRLGCSVAPG